MTESVTPRVRWAAIVWGIVVCAISAGTLFVLASADRQVAVLDWLEQLTAPQLIVGAVLAVGAVLVLLGALAMRRRGARQSPHPPIG